jgi:hypothetical protein
MNVIPLDTSKKRKQNKQEMLEVIEMLRQRIEEDDLEEFVTATMSPTGEIQIYIHVKDYIGGIGLFEIGKLTFINQMD